MQHPLRYLQQRRLRGSRPNRNGRAHATNPTVLPACLVAGLTRPLGAAARETMKRVLVATGVLAALGARAGWAQTADECVPAGVHNVYFESPETAHEWLTWRRALKEFTPKLFE